MLTSLLPAVRATGGGRATGEGRLCCAVLCCRKDIYEAVAHGRQARARIAPALFPVLPLALFCWLLNQNERPIAGINCCHASVPYFPLLPITADPTILHPLLPRLPLRLQPFAAAGTGPPSINYGLTHVIRRLHLINCHWQTASIHYLTTFRAHRALLILHSSRSSVSQDLPSLHSSQPNRHYAHHSLLHCAASGPCQRADGKAR